MRLSLPPGRRGGAPRCVFPDVFHCLCDRLNFLRVEIAYRVSPYFGETANAAASHGHTHREGFGHRNSETFKERWE